MSLLNQEQQQIQSQKTGTLTASEPRKLQVDQSTKYTYRPNIQTTFESSEIKKKYEPPKLVFSSQLTSQTRPKGSGFAALKQNVYTPDKDSKKTKPLRLHFRFSPNENLDHKSIHRRLFNPFTNLELPRNNSRKSDLPCCNKRNTGSLLHLSSSLLLPSSFPNFK